MGIGRAAVIVGLVPVHAVEGFKAIAAIGGGVDFFAGTFFHIPDGEPILP